MFNFILVENNFNKKINNFYYFKCFFVKQILIKLLIYKINFKFLNFFFN